MFYFDIYPRIMFYFDIYFSKQKSYSIQNEKNK